MSTIYFRIITHALGLVHESGRRVFAELEVPGGSNGDRVSVLPCCGPLATTGPLSRQFLDADPW